jgi:Asp/Glu/hydantoin racemase
MKIGIVYTSTTPELIEVVEREVKNAIGNEAELYSQEDASILNEVRDTGYVTAPPAARLIHMFMNAVEAGCDAILNACSSVGEVADSVQPAARYLGVPIVRIDEEMCREAVRQSQRIAVMATLQTTLAPTKHTIERVAREMGRHVECVDCLVEGAFGLNPEQFKQRMAQCAQNIDKTAGVILFAQGSMAYCEEYIAGLTGKLTLSSPRFGAMALRAALAAKGVIGQ